MNARANLGSTYANVGDLEAAREHYRAALNLSWQFGDRHAESLILTNLGNLYFSQGHPEQAIDYWDQSLQIFSPLGGDRNAALVEMSLVRAARQLGDAEKAAFYLTLARPPAKDLGLDTGSFESRLMPSEAKPND